MDSLIRVLVVDDSAFMRKMITDLLEEDNRIQVVASARNGQDALEKISQLDPDVVTLDIEMPIMNGLEALKLIMKTKPKPVIMVSSTTTVGAENTVLAMSYGAIEFIAKPSGPISLDLRNVQTELIEKVIICANVKLSKLFQTQQQKTLRLSKLSLKQKQPIELLEKKIVAIGTSTGGPKALTQVLTKLSEGLNAPILIVQHMPAGFTKSLAARINSLSKIRVKEAEDGEIIKKGVAYIAPGGYHLKVRSIGTSVAIQLDQSPPENGHRPAVDTMFSSLASIRDHSIITVIMTGMGSDGTKGLLKLKKNKGVVAIVESEESAVVFGMPRAAIKTNKVDEVVHLDEIASAIERYC
ncbi:chemotaxis response regulator protein-glutamate methylesterase [Bacillaceae bacterium IKA-2]|nr:chemotaxis response regulator protein-glutamate methylesterase [Bacillaceae bacterium IKA-2]